MELDIQQLFLEKLTLSAFLETVFRTVLMFLTVVLLLRLTGKRGLRQLSAFEMVVVITLGPSAGDAMFYGHIGLLHVISGFVLILLGYRLILYFVQKSEKAELLLVGGPTYIIRDGAFIAERLQTLNMGRDELFGELRSQGVEHLGQIKSAVIEDDGEISLSFYDNSQVKSGLPLLPDEYLKKSTQILQRGLYACCRCGTTRQLEKNETHRCEDCNGQEWVRSLDRLRIP